MRTSATVLLAASAVASAQVTYNSTTGQYTCARPGSAFCAGDSLGTDIIIRCDATGRGQPGRCSDNLAGQPPLGVQPALCWQSQTQAGDAACVKNCVVYPAAPSAPFQLPAGVCTPLPVPSGSSGSSTIGRPSAASNATSARTTAYTTRAASSTARFPSSASSAPRPTGTGSGGSGGGTNPYPSGNGNSTAPTSGGGSGASGSPSGTRTPIPPSGTRTGGPVTVPTGSGAMQNTAGYLAVAGLVAAYFF